MRSNDMFLSYGWLNENTLVRVASAVLMVLFVDRYGYHLENSFVVVIRQPE